jgi:hypothetical protein|nr:MAG TPA: hypothetical protein [Bacteriophage sp.]
MKYIHLYNDNSYCESQSFKGTPNTIVLTDEQYEQLGKTLEFRDGQLVEMDEEEKNKQMTALNAPKSTIE